MAVELTDKMIRGYSTQRRLDVWDARVTGLVLRVTPSGAKSWSVFYRFSGQQRRYKLGAWKAEETRGAGLTLASARRDAERVLAQVRTGTDPQAAKSEAKRVAQHEAAERRRLEAQGGPLTVERLVARCLDALPLRPTTAKEWRRLASVEITPTLRERLAVELTKGEVREWSREIARRSAYTANRAFEVLRRAYTWGLGEDLLDRTPFVGLSKPGVEEQSDRVLSADEIRAVWLALDALATETPGEWANIPAKAQARRHAERLAYVDATRLLFLTGVRRDMVLGAKLREFTGLDDAESSWAIPGGFEGRSKSGRVHVVPLSRSAAEIIRRRVEVVKGEALFPVTRRGAITEGSVDAGMSWSSKFVAALKARAEQELGAPIPRWRIHDLRHTIGTHLREDLKVSSEVVSMLLGHTPEGPRVSRVYNRAELLPERRAALTAWAAWVERIASERKGAAVLPMRSKARS